MKFLHKKISRAKIKKNLIGYLLMIPSLFLFGFFVFAPLISNISLSFYSTIGFEKDQFVGFANYAAVFSDANFIAALKNTFLYAFWSLLIGFLLPIFLGLLLSEVTRFKGLFRVTLYLPSIISGIAVVILWTFLLDPAAGAPLNALIKAFGGKPLLFLDDPKMTIPLIVITMTWRGAGSSALIYLSTMQTIGTDLYEAARLEGAGMFERIRYVTLPHLKPLINTMFIMQMIAVLQVFYEPLVMTDGGGPGNSSLSLMLLSYLYAFRDNAPAKAAAVGVILSFIIIVLTVVYFVVTNRQAKGENK
ncbi:MAG: sugar ABC transporter permease [Bacilli bacterium]|jgi:multiple sugar transport system permease protein|nr:sugar ABC transporter permease [Bacilli bacterium]MCH4235690.1 sugar ABC transporter permease [Bacilli bacterium]